MEQTTSKSCPSALTAFYRACLKFQYLFHKPHHLLPSYRPTQILITAFRRILEPMPTSPDFSLTFKMNALLAFLLFRIPLIFDKMYKLCYIFSPLGPNNLLSNLLSNNVNPVI